MFVISLTSVIICYCKLCAGHTLIKLQKLNQYQLKDGDNKTIIKITYLFQIKTKLFCSTKSLVGIMSINASGRNNQISGQKWPLKVNTCHEESCFYESA